MIAAAAICPCPPLLARELTGDAVVLPELRAACAAAVARLAADAPDVIVVTGPAQETASWPADGRFAAIAYAPALETAGRTGPGSSYGIGGGPPLPLSLGIGARLLDEASYAGPRAFRAVAALAEPADCLRLGRAIANCAPRVALLAMGDGSARRSVSAPGYLDERAAPFDAAVERAVRDGDLAALAALDADLAVELLAGGRPAWQVLAGALGAGDLALTAGDPVPATAGDPAVATAGDPALAGAALDLAGAVRPETEILYCDAPFGVGYLTAVLIPGRRAAG